MITFPKEILIYMRLEQLLSFVIAIVTVDTREEMGPEKIQDRYRHTDNGIVS